ncbi:MAG: protein kinase [Verrucomicrobia bacterium]|nr:protein kinase [Verrucomicrobiota bacterium]
MSISFTCPRCGRQRVAMRPGEHCPSYLLRLGFPGEGSEDVLERHRPAPFTGQKFGPYELLERLGEGGMGTVYRARHGELGRWVALKLLSGAGFASSHLVARFHLEAQAAARLDHPHIIPIYETGEEAGQPYLAMKLVEGQSLDRLIRQGQFEWGPSARAVQVRIAGLLATVADAVQYAHQRGVLHRDLKSANILVDAAGEPHLTDFGIAKLAQEESGLTRTMELLGTPGYMAPELAGDSTASVASDVYSLGVILYELLTGHLPFEAKGTAEMLRQIREVEPRPPAGINAEVHPDLQTICLKCLAKEPDRRYPNAAELAEDLRRYIRNEPIQARPASARERLWRWSRRKPALAATLVLLGVVSGIGLSAVFWQWQRAERLSAAEARERQRAESALQQLRLDGADTLLAEGENALAMAHLGQALRQTPIIPGQPIG